MFFFLKGHPNHPAHNQEPLYSVNNKHTEQDSECSTALKLSVLSVCCVIQQISNTQSMPSSCTHTHTQRSTLPHRTEYRSHRTTSHSCDPARLVISICKGNNLKKRYSFKVINSNQPVHMRPLNQACPSLLAAVPL